MSSREVRGAALTNHATFAVIQITSVMIITFRFELISCKSDEFTSYIVIHNTDLHVDITFTVIL